MIPGAATINWVVSNQGYSFLTAPSSTLTYYVDGYGIKRAMVYHGHPKPDVCVSELKEYVNWRLTPQENYPEITFSKDFTIIKINLIEKLYER